MKSHRRMIYLLALWLAGCNSVSSQITTPTQPIPAASVTAAPTNVPPTPVATRTPRPTPDRYATEFWVTSTAIVEAVVGTQTPRTHATYISPDGNWQAEVVIYDCVKVDPSPEADSNAYEQLRLVERGSGDIKAADGQLQNCGGLGAFGLEGLFWSQNSRYFYYTAAREGVPDGCGGFWQRPIRQLDIGTLGIAELGGGSLSPDGTKIASWQGNELVIWDVNEGNQAGVTSPIVLNTETGTGPIVWSPDSQALVYLQAESYCPLSGNSLVVHATLSTLQQEVLLESEAPTFGGADWNKNNVLVLSDENGKEWVYTFDDRKLEPVP